ncbi:MAG: hypothetical protein AB1405_12750, partial [Bdellovibrionota bacterium]
SGPSVHRQQTPLSFPRPVTGKGSNRLALEFQKNARAVAKFFGLPLPLAPEEIHVFSAGEEKLLEKFLRKAGFTPSLLSETRRNVRAGSSYFIPYPGAVYLAGDEPAAIAEEASHFVRHACGGTPPARTRPDLFYQLLLNETAGYLGSKLLCPERKTLSEGEILAEFRSPSFGRAPFEKSAIETAARHLLAEADPEEAEALPRLYRSSLARVVGAAHLLGYSLAERLHAAILRKRYPTACARELFTEDWSAPGAGLARYITLKAQLAGIIRPSKSALHAS